MQIIPSILVKTSEEFTKQITSLEDSLKMAQLDIADGVFVPNTTWADPEIVKNIAKIDIELHLMVKYPLNELKRWQNVPQIKRVLFHFESADDINKVIAEIKKNHWEAGIVLNPDTDIKMIDPYINQLSVVMFMAIIPGFQGQKFIPKTLDRIRKFKIKYPACLVAVDGAVNSDTVTDIAKAGADIVCPGSAVFNDRGSVKDNLTQLNDKF
jgi:ribulose-phosphate 3-epimerase